MRLILLIIAIIIIMILLIVIYKQCYKLKGSAATTTMKVQNTNNDDFKITHIYKNNMLRELKNDYADNLIRDDIKQYFTNYTGKPIYEVNNEGPDAARKRGPDAYFKDVVRRVCISLFDNNKYNKKDFCVTMDESFEQMFEDNKNISNNVDFSSYELYKKIEPKKTIISCEWNESLMNHMNKCLITDFVNIFSLLLTGDSVVTIIVSLDKDGKLIPNAGNNKPIQIEYNSDCKYKDYYQNDGESDYYSYNYNYMNGGVIDMIEKQNYTIEQIRQILQDPQIQQKPDIDNLTLNLFEQIIDNSDNNKKDFSREGIMANGNAPNNDYTSFINNKKLLVNCRQLGKISKNSKMLENLITNSFKHKIDMWNQIVNNYNYESQYDKYQSNKNIDLINGYNIKDFIVKASEKAAKSYKTIIKKDIKKDYEITIKENNKTITKTITEKESEIISNTSDGTKYCTYLHIKSDGTSTYKFRLDLNSNSYFIQDSNKNEISLSPKTNVWGPVQNPDLLMTLNGGDDGMVENVYKMVEDDYEINKDDYDKTYVMDTFNKTCRLYDNII